MKHAILITFAFALVGCPMVTTSNSRLDVPATIELLDEAMQRRVDLSDRVLAWSEERTVLSNELNNVTTNRAVLLERQKMVMDTRGAQAEKLKVAMAMPVSSNGPNPKIAELTKEVAELTKEVAELTQEIAILDSKVKELSGQILEKAELMRNNLGLLNAEDTVAAMLVKTAIGEFKAGESVTITFGEVAE